MSVKNLLDPILEQGIKNTNFFEGRLLAGQDLRDQQDANRQHDRYLGRAIGQGIIEGLEVSLDDGHDGSDGNPPVVLVKKGQAINFAGDVFGLPTNDIKLALSRSIEAPKIEIADFYACAGAPNHQHLPNGVGVYILVMSPTSGYRERALKSGLGDGGVARGCGKKFTQEGVQFRLEEVTTDMLTSIDGVRESTRDLIKDDFLDNSRPVSLAPDDIGRLSLFRNVLAHLCFGTEWMMNSNSSIDERNIDGISPDVTSALRKVNIINDCDVVLTTLYWTLEGIAFLDMWSVRRVVRENQRLLSRLELKNNFRESVNTAMQMQFNQHIDFLLDQSLRNPVLSHFNLSELFQYMPPTGSIPVIGSGSKNGFYIDELFEGRADTASAVLSDNDMRNLFRRSKGLSPMVVPDTDYINLYWSKTNLEKVSSGNTDQLYLIFASRDSHYFRDEDAISRTLKQAWNSYKMLIQKNAILPRSITDDSLPVWLAIDTVLQSIMQYSLVESVVCSSGAVIRKQVTHVFSAMYSLQKELTTVLEYRFSGDNDFPNRHALAVELLRHLDGEGLPGERWSLVASIDADNVWGMIEAQSAINHIISQWSGDIVIGFIEMRHIASPDGDILVPGGGDFTYRYALKAVTDRNATVVLSAGIFEASSGNWGDTVHIIDVTTGDEITEISLNRLQEKFIDIVVTPPTGADPGQDVVLRLRSSIPPPTNHQWELDRPLTVDNETGDPVTWSLTPALSFVTPGRLNADTNHEYQFIIRTSCSISQVDLTAATTFTLNLTFHAGTLASEWGVRIDGRPDARVDDTTFQYERTLNDGEFEETDIRITTPVDRGGVAKTCTAQLVVVGTVIDPETGPETRTEIYETGLQVTLEP